MGTLKAYQLNSDGTLPVDANGNPLNSPIWDAGVELKGLPQMLENFYLCARGDERFTSANITKEDLGWRPMRSVTQ